MVKVNKIKTKIIYSNLLQVLRLHNFYDFSKSIFVLAIDVIQFSWFCERYRVGDFIEFALSIKFSSLNVNSVNF